MDSFVKKAGALLALAAAIWIFYFGLAFGTQNTLWTDEGDYVLLAQSIIERGTYEVMPDPLGMLDRSARSYGIPYFTAVMSTITGEYIFAGHLAVALLCALAVLATYILARKYFGDLSAIIAVLLLSFSQLLWFYSSRVLTDAPQMAFAALGVYAFLRVIREQNAKWMVVFVLSILFGGFTKYTFFAIIFGIAVAAFLYRDAIIKTALKSPKATGVSVLLFAGFAASFLLYQLSKTGSPFGLAGEYFAGAASFGTVDTWLFFTMSNWIFSTAFGAILVAFGIAYAFLKPDENAQFLSYILLVPMLVMTFFLAYKEDRFIIFLLPIAFVLAGRLLADAIIAIADAASGKASPGFWTAASCLLVIFLYTATFGNLSSCWGLYQDKQSSYSEVQEASYYIKNITKPGEWVLASGNPQVGAYSSRYVNGLNPNYTEFLRVSSAYNSTVYMTSLWEASGALSVVFSAINNGTALYGNTYYELFTDEKKYSLVKMFSRNTVDDSGKPVSQPMVFVFKKK
ncbi:MAG: glycosyltransferase family 39 protein [Candidatus Micrarchaeia archaeon]|jgi:4-amino-4-deoxy-L-arabinose transferase-like glycosyltransferase